MQGRRSFHPRPARGRVPELVSHPRLCPACATCPTNRGTLEGTLVRIRRCLGSWARALVAGEEKQMGFHHYGVGDRRLLGFLSRVPSLAGFFHP